MIAGIKPSAPNFAFSRIPFIGSQPRVLANTPWPDRSSLRDSEIWMRPAPRWLRLRLALGRDVPENLRRRTRLLESAPSRPPGASDQDRSLSWFHPNPCSSVEFRLLQVQLRF